MPNHPFQTIAAAGCLCLCGAAAVAQETEFTNGVNISDGSSISADLFVNDNTVLDGQACVGQGCGGDTHSFAGVNADLHISSGFPGIQFNSGALEWLMTADDSVISNVNRFAIWDRSTTTTIPFSIEAGAPSNAFWIKATTGDIGLGTMFPTNDLHIVGGFEPGIRIEQDTSQGQPAYGWDILASDQGIGFADLPFQRVPFFVQSGAPAFSVLVDPDGDIGLGTQTPNAALHLLRDDGTAGVRIEEASTTRANNRVLMELVNNGASQIALIDTFTGSDWRFQNFDGAFRVNKAGTGVTEMTLDAAGNLTILGSLTQSSDRNAKTGIVPVDPAAILAKVAALPVAEWSYTDTADVRHIGPMAQDFRALFGTGASDTGISTLDTSGVALAAIQALAEQNAALIARLDRQAAEIADLRTQIQAATP